MLDFYLNLKFMLFILYKFDSRDFIKSESFTDVVGGMLEIILPSLLIKNF